MNLTINQAFFVQSFDTFLRNSESYQNKFSDAALEALFEEFEDAEWEDEIDYTAIICEYTEYSQEELLEAGEDLAGYSIETALARFDYYIALSNGNYLVRND